MLERYATVFRTWADAYRLPRAHSYGCQRILTSTTSSRAGLLITSDPREIGVLRAELQLLFKYFKSFEIRFAVGHLVYMWCIEPAAVERDLLAG